MAPENYIFDNDAAGSQLKQPFSKNLLGANLDVVSSLNLIQFESGVDGSLRNSIAYITPWRRRGVTGRTQAGTSPNSVGTDNSLGSLLSGLWNDPFEIDNLGFDLGFSLLSEDANTNIVPKWNPDESLWEESQVSYGFPFFDDTKGKIFSSELYTKYSLDENDELSTDPSGAKKKQAALMRDNAVGLRQALALGASVASDLLLRDNPGAQEVVDGTIRGLSSIFKAPSGPIYVGNTAGTIIDQARSLASSFGVSQRSAYLGTTVIPDFSSKVPKSSSLSTSPVETYGGGAWQFLFNPSQLSLSAGPNFKKAETWGVMDEANAGSPLHFTSMKNPELKFSKVLLNGYVFGRQVEELEQGLIELFMDDKSGDAKHGPKVLEFVWGKKSFGPCVIKDVRVNQKMWDEGLLVSAEVDFTLERVPEWTINDGYVSAYDPTNQRTFSQPTISSSSEPTSVGRQQPEPETETNTEPSRPSTPPPPPVDYKKCGIINRGIQNVNQLLRNADYYKKRVLDFGKAQFLGSSFFGEPGMDPDIALSKMNSEYVNWNGRTNAGGFIPAASNDCGIPSLNNEREKIGDMPDYKGFGGSRAQNSEKMAGAARLLDKYKKCIKSRQALLSKELEKHCSRGGPQSIDPDAPGYIVPGGSQ